MMYDRRGIYISNAAEERIKAFKIYRAGISSVIAAYILRTKHATNAEIKQFPQYCF